MSLYPYNSESDLLISGKENQDEQHQKQEDETTNSLDNNDGNIQRSYSSTSAAYAASLSNRILQNHPTYSTMEDPNSTYLHPKIQNSVRSSDVSSVDYETLLTFALENATKKVDQENQRKQKRNFLFTILGFVLIAALVITSTVIFTQETPEEKRLKKEIKDLEGDVDELNSQVDNFQNNEDIVLLKEDIDNKRDFIKELENDQSIDPAEKEQLIQQYQKQINDLKIVVKQLERDDGIPTLPPAQSPSQSNGNRNQKS